MTIQDLLDQGVAIEGLVQITTYNYDTNDTIVLYKGEDPRYAPEGSLNRSIKYIYPYIDIVIPPRSHGNVEIAGICIEVEGDEE